VQTQRTAEVDKLQDSLEHLKKDFSEYQDVKTQEISGLEQRIRELISQGAKPQSAKQGKEGIKGSQKAVKRGKSKTTPLGQGETWSQMLGKTAGSDPIVIPDGAGLLDATVNSAPSKFSTEVRSSICLASAFPASSCTTRFSAHHVASLG
jgi:hypothetical protein